jgi:hypothetical protein
MSHTANVSRVDRNGGEAGDRANASGIGVSEEEQAEARARMEVTEAEVDGARGTRRRMPRHRVGGGWGSWMAYFTFWKKLRILSKTRLKGSKKNVFFLDKFW